MFQRNQVIIYGKDPLPIITNPENRVTYILADTHHPIQVKPKPGFFFWRSDKLIKAELMNYYKYFVNNGEQFRTSWRARLRQIYHITYILVVGHWNKFWGRK